MKRKQSRFDRPGEQGGSITKEYIATDGLSNFSLNRPLPKREGVYIHTRSPRLAGGVPAIVLTDGMEDETEQINGMGSVDSTLVPDLNIHLKEYKSYFLRGV